MSETTGAPPASKRAKTEDDALDILSPTIFKSEEDLRQAYVVAKPFAHGRVENMFQTGVLGTLRYVVVIFVQFFLSFCIVLNYAYDIESKSLTHLLSQNKYWKKSNKIPKSSSKNPISFASIKVSI